MHLPRSGAARLLVGEALTVLPEPPSRTGGPHPNQIPRSPAPLSAPGEPVLGANIMDYTPNQEGQRATQDGALFTLVLILALQ